MNVAPGDRVDRYELEALLGEGGQGSVWRATDPLAPGVPRAVKLVSIHSVEATSLERARREARALARLEHPSLCRCYGLFEDVKLDVLGFAMDFVDGMSLADAAGDPRMTPAMQDAALGHVANALAYVHANGLVHRDVKPENVLLESAFWGAPGDPRHVKLVDFGIAVGGFGARLTKVGHGIGTPPYMAPEQIEPLRWGEARSPATDVFAFGVLVWLVATGRHPTGLDGSASFGDYAVAYRTAADSKAWPPRLPVKSGFAAVLPRCLALHPPDRWRDAAAMLEPLGGKRSPKTVDDHAVAGGGGRTKTEPFEPPTAPDRTPRPPPTVEQRPVVHRRSQRDSRPASGQHQGRRWQVAAVVGAAGLLGAVVLAVSLGGDEESEAEAEPRPRRAVEPTRSAPAESAPSPAEVSVQRPAPAPRLGGGEAAPQPKWNVGETVDAEITLVTTDHKDLGCALAEEIAGKHCAFESQNKRNTKSSDSRTNANLLQPYTTTNNMHLLGAGLWMAPAVKAKLDEETWDRPGPRFAVTCKFAVEGVAKDVWTSPDSVDSPAMLPSSRFSRS